MSNVTDLAQRRQATLSELRKMREELLVIIDKLRAGEIATDHLQQAISYLEIEIRKLEPPAG